MNSGVRLIMSTTSSTVWERTESMCAGTKGRGVEPLGALGGRGKGADDAAAALRRGCDDGCGEDSGGLRLSGEEKPPGSSSICAMRGEHCKLTFTAE